MNWVEKMRNKPREERIRAIWVFVAIAAALLIMTWIVTWGYRKSAPKDTKLFDAVKQGATDVKNNFKKPSR